MDATLAAQSDVPVNTFILGMSADEYRLMPGLNFTHAKRLHQSPWHFFKLLTVEQEETLDMTMGKFIHSFVLEDVIPDYVIRPEFDPAKPGEKWHGGRNSCKAWVAEQEKAGRVVFSPDESQRELAMCNALANSEDACEFLRACPEREVSVFAHYRGVRIKARLDAARINPNAPGIVDIKKMRDISPRAFGQAVAERRMLMQAAWYQTALGIAIGAATRPAWAWLAVEDSHAAPAQVYQPDPLQLTLGQAEVDDAIDIFLACLKTGEWPAFGKGPLSFDLPRWRLAEHQTRIAP